MMEAWKNKRVLVVGMARSGLAAAEMLSEIGARAVLSDTKETIDGIDRLKAMGCAVRLGERSETLVRGADAVIVSPGVPPDAPVIGEARRLGVPLMAELEAASRFVQGVKIAITGTNGKTTTSALTGEILKNAGKNTYVAGNIGLPLSSVALKTRPEDYTVIEVSSFQLEHVDTFHPHVAALLNLTPDHLNRHGTMEAYGALKERMLKNQTERDFFIYNADDPFCRQAAGRQRAKAVPFSRTQAQKTGAWMQDGQLMVAGRALLTVEELSLPGPHNLENALAAAAIASELQVPAPVIRHTLRSFQGVEHRMESVRVLDGVKFINDSKGTNPESSIRAVEAMAVPTVLIAGGEDKGMRFDGFASAIRQNEHIRHVVLIGKTAETLREALEKAGYTAYTLAGVDFEKAVSLARELAVPGGAVLLSPACASFDMFKDFEDRGRRFKEIVGEMK